MNNRSQDIMGDEFPDLIWGLESILKLNCKAKSKSDYIDLKQDETPFWKVVDASEYFTNEFAAQTLTPDDMVNIIQRINPETMHLAFLGMYSEAHRSIILIPSKANYQGVGEVAFMELMNDIKNTQLSNRKDINEDIRKRLRALLDNPSFKKTEMTLELRTLALMYVFLDILNNTLMASFLAQFILIQEKLTR